MINNIFSLALICLGASQIDAFPHLKVKDARPLTTRAKTAEECPHLALNKQAKRQLAFDPKSQYVSTTGQHAWVAPNSALGDQRGPCPGLNALANHGYLPHNGVADITTIIDAVNTAYGMAVDLGGFLAVYGALYDGNALSLTPGYSIGGPAASEAILSGFGLLGTPPGLSGSHNNYEADSSPTRGDLYVTGNDYLLQLDLFQRYYDALPDNMAAPKQYSALLPFRQARFNDSIAGNPYFFYPPFAGILVSPAGYAFPPAMMANHSAEYPDGYLDKQTFKSFFAISGDSGSFKYQAGYERIPDNWYKRPVGDEYTIPGYLADVLQFGIEDPRLLSVGGNTGTNNSFTGLDIGALTNGVFNSATLAQGNSLECFVFQLVQSETPGLLTGVYEDVTKAIQPLVQNIASNLKGLSCPQLGSVDESQYGRYPGYMKAKGAV